MLYFKIIAIFAGELLIIKNRIMKTIRLFGIVFLTVLMSVSFSSCSKSDDDNGGETSASIEGTWYLKSEKWFTNESRTQVRSEKSYGDYSKERVWVIKKSGNEISLTENGKERTMTKLGNNEYRKNNDKFVVKTLTSKSLIVDYSDNYFKEKDEYKEYGVYAFMR